MLNPRVRLPPAGGGEVSMECPVHGVMPWAGDGWRCAAAGCPAVVTEADMARLARWLGGERLAG